MSCTLFSMHPSIFPLLAVSCIFSLFCLPTCLHRDMLFSVALHGVFFKAERCDRGSARLALTGCKGKAECSGPGREHKKRREREKRDIRRDITAVTLIPLTLFVVILGEQIKFWHGSHLFLTHGNTLCLHPQQFVRAGEQRAQEFLRKENVT